MTAQAPRRGRISFIGAGPGAADLITVRGARRIEEADIVVWAASLVAPECVQEHARADAELVDSSRLTHEEAVEIYRRAERDWLKVARVHSGDPALWGAVQEQYDACARMELDVEIVPGVAAFSAAAAAVGRELTVPEVAQSVVLTRLEGGKTPMPSGEKVREFAQHGTTMALFLSAARTGQLVEELRAGGYSDDTPVLVAYKVTWPDELLVRTTLGELEVTVKQHKLWRHTLFLVGQALTAGGTRSHLYHAGHFHTYRRADPEARRALRATRGSRRPTSRYSGGEAARADSAPSEALPAQRAEASESGRPESMAQAGSDTAPSNAVPTNAVPTNAVPKNAAWWAVQDWQEHARGVSKVAAARAATARKVAGQDGPDLFAENGNAAATGTSSSEAPQESAPAVPGTPKSPETPEKPEAPEKLETSDKAPSKTTSAATTPTSTTGAKAKGTAAKSTAKTGAKTTAKRKTSTSRKQPAGRKRATGEGSAQQ